MARATSSRAVRLFASGGLLAVAAAAYAQAQSTPSTAPATVPCPDYMMQGGMWPGMMGRGTMGPGMMGWNGARDGMWEGWMPFQGILFALLVLLILVGIVFLVLMIFRTRAERSDTAPRSSAIEILEQRYAKGELEREEYLQMKSDLGG